MIIENPIKKRLFYDHVFLVAGLDPNANLFDPFTYGSNATLLCPWWLTGEEKGLFLPVRKGVKKIKKAFRLNNKERKSVKFEPKDDYCNYDNGYKSPTFATVDQLLPKFKNS